MGLVLEVVGLTKLVLSSALRVGHGDAPECLDFHRLVEQELKHRGTCVVRSSINHLE